MRWLQFGHTFLAFVCVLGTMTTSTTTAAFTPFVPEAPVTIVTCRHNVHSGKSTRVTRYKISVARPCRPQYYLSKKCSYPSDCWKKDGNRRNINLSMDSSAIEPQRPWPRRHPLCSWGVGQNDGFRKMHYVFQGSCKYGNGYILFYIVFIVT